MPSSLSHFLHKPKCSFTPDETDNRGVKLHWKHLMLINILIINHQCAITLDFKYSVQSTCIFKFVKEYNELYYIINNEQQSYSRVVVEQLCTFIISRQRGGGNVKKPVSKICLCIVYTITAILIFFCSGGQISACKDIVSSYVLL